MRVFLQLIALLVPAAALLRSAEPADALSPPILPGRGLAQHDFVYAGEWDTRKPDCQSLFVVRGGRVDCWARIPLHTATGGAQEFDDAAMFPDGHLLFARMSGAGELRADKSVVWDFTCPAGTECHSVQPVGRHFALLALNGTPPQALIIDRRDGRIARRLSIPTTTKNSHAQYRHIRMTPGRSILVPLLGEDRVIELSLDGKELWSVPAKSPWSAVRLKNGNTLIAGDWSRYVREVDRSGRIVWEFTQADVPAIRLFNIQTAHRLKNGNTVLCSWVAGDPNTAKWPNTVQVLEVTRDKQVLWALRSWDGANDLGPATHIQILDQECDEVAAPDDFIP